MTQRDPLVGKTFAGRFMVEESLGQGGMATVYRAFDPGRGRHVALKVLHAELGGDPEVVQRFRRELELTSRIEHPGIVRVYEAGREEQDRLFLVLELIEGRTLEDVLDTDAPLEPERVANLGLQLAEALAAAHDRDVIHRDLKPGNILLMGEQQGQDRVKIFDFGLARFLESESEGLTAADARVGTPMYMSPEYIQSYEQDHRGDLYGLGMVLYELTTGATPWTGSPYEILHKAVSEPLTPPSAHVPVPPWLESIILALLARRPEHRPASGREVAQALRHKVPIEQLREAPVPPPPAPSHGRTLLALAVGVSFALLVLIALVAWVVL